MLFHMFTLTVSIIGANYDILSFEKLFWIRNFEDKSHGSTCTRDREILLYSGSHVIWKWNYWPFHGFYVAGIISITRLCLRWLEPVKRRGRRFPNIWAYTCHVVMRAILHGGRMVKSAKVRKAAYEGIIQSFFDQLIERSENSNNNHRPLAGTPPRTPHTWMRFIYYVTTPNSFYSHIELIIFSLKPKLVATLWRVWRRLQHVWLFLWRYCFLVSIQFTFRR